MEAHVWKHPKQYPRELCSEITLRTIVLEQIVQ